MKKNQINLFLDYLQNSLDTLDFFKKYPEISQKDIKKFIINCKERLFPKTIKIFTDGASRGNPGKAGAGFVIMDSSNNIIKKGNKFLGIKTNNEAEYIALILALESINLKNLNEIELYLDSELVVKQIKGEYKVKNARLKELYKKVISLLSGHNYKITHIPRGKNSIADNLANEAIDTY